MLTFKIRVPEVPDSSAEHIHSDAVGLLLPDNVRTCHGDPGSHVTYLSKRFGNIKLSLVDPYSQDERLLFAHRIWNSGIQMAEFIGEAGHESEMYDRWKVEGHSVLELGAGAWASGILRARLTHG